MGGSSANSPAAVTPVQTEVQPTPTQEKIDNWWDNKPGFQDAEVGTYSTLFGENIDAVKKPFEGGYNLFDIETENHIGVYNEYTPSNFNIYSELQPEQARALEDQYGSIVSLTMEQADTDGDGALDKVAVRYEGSKGEKTVVMEYSEGSNSVSSYIMGVVYLS